jgi:hypothetical protein
MNRLAPLAMNVRLTLRALGPTAKHVLSDYWRDHPRGHAHFFLESDRFCKWLRERLDVGEQMSSEVRSLLDRESSAIRAAVRASCTESD